MKTAPVLLLLGIACLAFPLEVKSQGATGCSLGDMLQLDQPDFPDIEKLAYGSYQMSVEFTLPNTHQTDFYSEYYDIELGKGRVDAHQDGRYLQYIYKQDSWEAWNLEGDSCNLQNITDTPVMFNDYQENWVYEPSAKDTNLRTVGPSAMFKQALKQWRSGNTSEERKMVYLGEQPHTLVRGIKTQMWRWCETPTTSIDYIFTVNKTETAYNLKKLNIVPLRVTFNGNWSGTSVAQLSDQYYDIMNFQPYISVGEDPFRLPKGKNCRRSTYYPHQLPGFSTMDMWFNAEVIYRKVNKKDKDDSLSFYSKITYAVDREAQLMAYYYSPWNTTKTKDSEGKERTKYEVVPTQTVIFDTQYGYSYNIDYSTGKCQMGRGASFSPVYVLPNNAGNISLDDPYILFPNNELSYLTQTKERGLTVDVFEAYQENYKLGSIEVKKAIITHSYLKDDIILENNIPIKRAPTQIELHLFKTDDVEEIVTFNFFRFTTRLYNRKALFDVTRCFKNDDDYSWVTLGFETDDTSVDLSAIPVRQIQSNIMSFLDIDVSLKPTRVPTVMVDATKELYVSMLLLQKPTLRLDYGVETSGKSIESTDVLGLADFDTCATTCLEKANCWGFSLCGKECFFGTLPTAKVVDNKDCSLYRRYNNDTYLKSKEAVLQDLQNQVSNGNVKLKLIVDSKEVTVKATSIDITDPAEDDTTFRRMGNRLNPRMQTVKVGYNLKKTGSSMKSLGKMQFSECQKFCLDFKDCETVSFCLIDSDCVISTKYGEDIKSDDMEANYTCQIVTRKYADNFDRSPGLFLAVDASKTLDKSKIEDCAKACLKETGFDCRSFDHCPQESSGLCRLHKVHFLNKKTKKESLTVKPTCGHYSRKYSTSFKKHAESHVLDTTLPPITNLTLEECAKECMEYSGGSCYGFDFCQGSVLYSTSCFILDSDPSRKTTSYSYTCSNYLRTEPEFAPRPFTTSYAGGIGFLCFLIGGLVGAALVFAIAYFRVNRR